MECIKKLFKYMLITFSVLVLLKIAFLVIAYHISLHQTWEQFDASVMPDKLGTTWETEDGFLSYYNDRLTSEVIEGLAGREHTIHYYKRPGVVCVGEETFDVQVSFGEEGTPSMHIVRLDDEEQETQPNVCIESWNAKDYIETDNEIIFIFEAEETTYYEVGQEIRLVYKKK